MMMSTNRGQSPRSRRLQQVALPSFDNTEVVSRVYTMPIQSFYRQAVPLRRQRQEKEKSLPLLASTQRLNKSPGSRAQWEAMRRKRVVQTDRGTMAVVGPKLSALGWDDAVSIRAALIREMNHHQYEIEQEQVARQARIARYNINQRRLKKIRALEMMVRGDTAEPQQQQRRTPRSSAGSNRSGNSASRQPAQEQEPEEVVAPTLEKFVEEEQKEEDEVEVEFKIERQEGNDMRAKERRASLLMIEADEAEEDNEEDEDEEEDVEEEDDDVFSEDDDDISEAFYGEKLTDGQEAVRRYEMLHAKLTEFIDTESVSSYDSVDSFCCGVMLSGHSFPPDGSGICVHCRGVPARQKEYEQEEERYYTETEIVAMCSGMSPFYEQSRMHACPKIPRVNNLSQMQRRVSQIIYQENLPPAADTTTESTNKQKPFVLIL